LLHLAQKGQSEAYEELMGRYFERVLRIVRARMGPGLRARHDSMDIAQNAMLRVINSLKDFEPRSEGALIHWMSRLVENEIRDLADYNKAQKRDQKKEVPIHATSNSQIGLEGTLPDLSEKSPSQYFALNQELMALEESLDKLGKGKDVILMRNYAGMTFKEIGGELSLSEDAARMQYVRAMDKLTSIIAQD